MPVMAGAAVEVVPQMSQSAWGMAVDPPCGPSGSPRRTFLLQRTTVLLRRDPVRNAVPQLVLGKSVVRARSARATALEKRQRVLDAALEHLVGELAVGQRARQLQRTDQ